MGDVWVVHRTNDPRFAFHITIERNGEPSLRLLAPDRWPAAGRALFCVRMGEEVPDGLDLEEEIERVPIAAVERIGRKLAVVLDRKRFKRSDFLFVKRPRKGGGWGEQIFWQSQHTARGRRPRVKLTAQGRRRDFCVLVDSAERYAWAFRGCRTERRRLAVGDYALADGDELIAVVERKTLENLLAEFATLGALHQSLAELARVEHSALVVEAAYADFLSPRKVPYYGPVFCAKAIAEIYACHPGLRVVFVDTRKLAIEWTLRFFAAVWDRRAARDQIPLL
jgi:hypothetical protein